IMRNSQSNVREAASRARMCDRVRQVSWQDVRDEVARADANLAAVVDDSHVFRSRRSRSFEPRALLYRAEYEYGSLIVNEGKFVAPACNLKEECATCKNLKAATLNSPIPLALIL